MVVVPFIEPGTAGGATITEVGVRWLLDSEGGKPSDKPAALKKATKHVRASDEAARLPRAQVYGLKTPRVSRANGALSGRGIGAGSASSPRDAGR